MTVYQYNRLALTVNCGYARTVIRELSKPKRGKSWRNIEKCAREEEFRTLFDLPTFKLKEELFVSPNLQLHHPTPFDRYCDEINACFSKKWHPTAKRIEYLDIFSICRWKELPDSTKKLILLGTVLHAIMHTHLFKLLSQENPCMSLRLLLCFLQVQQKKA